MEKPVLALFLITSLFLISCETQKPAGTPEAEPKNLDDLQITVCEEADKAGTCQTRLIEIGIVMPDECCEVLGKCCQNVLGN